MVKTRHLLLAIAFYLLQSTTNAQTGNVPTGTDTACQNGLSVFQKLYKAANEDLSEWLTTTADSGYVFCGETNSLGSGSYDGMVTKVDRRGATVWSKAVGGSGDDRLYGVTRTSDNGFIAVGVTRSYGNTAGDAWLVKLDASGTVQWSKKYGNGNVNGEIAFEVVQLSDGGYAFCGAHQYAAGVTESFIVRTDNQGNITWSKQYGHGGSDEAWGITEDGNSLMVVGFYRAPDLYDGYVMKLDKATGAVQWKKTYDADNNRHTLMAKLKLTSSGYQVFSLVMDDFNGTNQQHCIWNLATDGTVQGVRKIVIPGTHTTGYGWTPLANGGFVTVNGENNTQADVFITKVDAGGNITWSKKYIKPGFQSIRAMIGSAEGTGFTAIGTDKQTGDLNDVFILKVDSLGSQGFCPTINTTDVTITLPVFTTSSISTPGIADVALNNPVITTTVVNYLPVTSTVCYSCAITIPVLPPDTVCSNTLSLYQKIYSGSKDDLAEWMAVAADSGYVIAGQTNSFGAGGIDGMLIKIKKNGSVQWSKAIGGSNNDILFGIKKTSDNGFIAIGQTKSFGNAAGEAWLVKTDAAGTVQWTKKYGDGNAVGDNAYEVVQTSDGGYAFCGAHLYAGGVSQSFVVRTDNQGNVVWSKVFDESGSDEAWGLMEDGNSLMVVGFYRAPNFYDGYLMKLDKATGAVQWKRTYDIDINRHTMMAKIRTTSSGYQVFALVMDDFNGTNQQHCVWNLATDGTVQSVRKLIVPGIQTSSYGWVPLPDGSFVVANGESNNAADVIMTKVNAAGNIVWSKKYARAGKQAIRVLIGSPDGGFAAAGINNNPGISADSSDVYFLRFDSLGNQGPCSAASTNDASVQTPAFTSSVITSGTVSNVTINNPVMNPAIANFVPSTNVLCFYCVPKPTGTEWPLTGRMSGGHEIRMYPNPVFNGTVTLQINALYNDKATINIVDINGTVRYSVGTKDISKGQNLLKIDFPMSLRNYSNYIIEIQFKDYTTAAKVFVFR